jgi:hypothetical protein
MNLGLRQAVGNPATRRTGRVSSCRSIETFLIWGVQIATIAATNFGLSAYRRRASTIAITSCERKNIAALNS